MNVRPARLEDLAAYAAFGRAAQAWLQSRGLGQYVPAAHEQDAPAIRARVASSTLYAVSDESATVAFFCLDPVRSEWWPVDGLPALYLAGMVVEQGAQGCGVGNFIIRWCAAQAVTRGCHFVRLDCHADNPWLCKYYEAHGFVLIDRVAQQPGYEACLYQLPVVADEITPRPLM